MTDCDRVDGGVQASGLITLPTVLILAISQKKQGFKYSEKYNREDEDGRWKAFWRRKEIAGEIM